MTQGRRPESICPNGDLCVIFAFTALYCILCTSDQLQNCTFAYDSVSLRPLTCGVPASSQVRSLGI